MIPQYPKFAKLQLNHRKNLEQFTKKFPPYSDYDFVSLWSWNVRGEAAISQLYGNLIIRLTDYLSGKKIYSLIGDNKVDDVLIVLLALSDSTIKLVPEVSIKSINKADKFRFEKDRDNYDYIYFVPNLLSMRGARFRNERWEINKFMSSVGTGLNTRSMDLGSNKNRIQILKLFKKWARSRNKTSSEIKNEASALMRLLQSATSLRIRAIGVYDGKNLIAFSIWHKTNDNYGLMHFHKADTAYKGIYSYLAMQEAKALHAMGLKYMNYEQDLGIPGLRKAKTLLHPVKFLKKYTVTLNK